SAELRALTATKVALNIISTGAIVVLGKVRGNLMIDLHPTSTKLRDRAVRVVAELTQSDYDTARQKLEASGWNLREIIGRPLRKLVFERICVFQCGQPRQFLIARRL